jgi:hypothetical protein
MGVSHCTPAWDIQRKGATWASSPSSGGDRGENPRARHAGRTRSDQRLTKAIREPARKLTSRATKIAVMDGRTVATCFIAGIDIAENITASGYAAPFTRYSDRCIDEGQAAEETRAGLWSAGFEPPWEYRARQEAGRTRSSPESVRLPLDIPDTTELLRRHRDGRDR